MYAYPVWNFRQLWVPCWSVGTLMFYKKQQALMQCCQLYYVPLFFRDQYNVMLQSFAPLFAIYRLFDFFNSQLLFGAPKFLSHIHIIVAPLKVFLKFGSTERRERPYTFTNATNPPLCLCHFSSRGRRASAVPCPHYSWFPAVTAAIWLLLPGRICCRGFRDEPSGTYDGCTERNCCT